MHPSPDIQEIPYLTDSFLWFAAIRHLSHPIWLDSCRPYSLYGRFDIISAAPQTVLETHGETTHITTQAQVISSSTDNPFILLGDHLGVLAPLENCPSLPFYGGALGYFGYDLGRRLENLPTVARQDINLPEMSVGIYPWAIIQDHDLKQAWLVKNSLIGAAYNFSIIENICQQQHPTLMFHDLKKILDFEEKSFKINEFKHNINKKDYINALTKIQSYINAGDCYQVNFAQRFSAAYSGDCLAAYLSLRQTLPSPFSGYMELNRGAVLSLSPERFIQVRAGAVEAKPIKGTIKRGLTPQTDAANAQWLINSQKNRAENVMIVDLLRNDLSKHCHGIQVPELCKLQTFANVHHLVSTVTGRLNKQSSPLQLLRDSFPGGSITGAPKIRAMEIIEELEPTRRSVYCGSLGYISVDGQMDTSIAIRTLVCADNTIYCWGGGGIVADSIADQEYEESLAKVDMLMTTLVSMFKT